MHLYHGTDANHVDAILEQGLQPREATGRSNWGHNDMESIPGHVYLTVLYAPYFGMAAVSDEDAMPPVAIYTIDVDRLDPTKLYPDEDFVEQASRDNMFGISVDIPDEVDLDPNGSMAERTAAIRDQIDALRHLWVESVEYLGNCSYKGTIPPEAIERAAVADPPSHVWMNIDPTITMANALTMANRYTFYTELFAGDEVTVDDGINAMVGVPLDQYEDEEAASFREQYRDQAEELVDGRDDWVTVHENPAYAGDKN